MPHRRGVLGTIATGATVVLAGCSQVVGDEEEISDTDGDGVIDSEDYAPRDPNVQEKSDIQEPRSTEATTETPKPTRDVTEAKQDQWLELLEQPLPDPEPYIPDGREGHDRSIGTVSVNTADGSVVLNGPGSGQVTAVAGYLAASGIEVQGFQEGNDETKQIATNATYGSDELSFAPGTFQGIALRANAGVDLVIDRDAVVERVNTVRYHVSRGVFERDR